MPSLSSSKQKCLAEKAAKKNAGGGPTGDGSPPTSTPTGSVNGASTPLTSMSGMNSKVGSSKVEISRLILILYLSMANYLSRGLRSRSTMDSDMVYLEQTVLESPPFSNQSPSAISKFLSISMSISSVAKPSDVNAVVTKGDSVTVKRQSRGFGTRKTEELK